MNEKEVTKRLKKLIQHITRMKKRMAERNLWLIGGFDALKPATDADQQGPMVTKLYEMVEDNRNYLKENK